MDRVQIKFFTRPGCHLCRRSLEVLKELETRFPLEIHKIDITGSPDLLKAYEYDIPVATVDGEELFRHRADVGEVEKLLEARFNAGA